MHADTCISDCEVRGVRITSTECTHCSVVPHDDVDIDLSPTGGKCCVASQIRVEWKARTATRSLAFNHQRHSQHPLSGSFCAQLIKGILHTKKRTKSAYLTVGPLYSFRHFLTRWREELTPPQADGQYSCTASERPGEWDLHTS